MEYSTSDAARLLGVSQRQVQRLAAAELVPSRILAGRIVLGGGAVTAAERLQRTGRPWRSSTVRAALELLETGATDLVTGSQLSRLKRRMRSMSVGQLAHQILSGRTTLLRSAGSSAPEIRCIVTEDTAHTARLEHLIPDPNGRVIVVELSTPAVEIVSDIVEFAYADARFSALAAARMTQRMEKL